MKKTRPKKRTVRARRPKTYAPRKRRAAPKTAPKRRAPRRNPKGLLDQPGIRLGGAALAGGVAGFYADGQPRVIQQASNAIVGAIGVGVLSHFFLKKSAHKQMGFAAAVGMFVAPAVKMIPAVSTTSTTTSTTTSALTTRPIPSLPSPNYNGIGASALSLVHGARPA